MGKAVDEAAQSYIGTVLDLPLRVVSGGRGLVRASEVLKGGTELARSL